MNDRELLELAAKAMFPECKDIDRLVEWKGSIEAPAWNPLTDDGDALRLAAKLRLLIDTQYNGGVAVGSASFEEVWEPILPCPYTATRRAIVRAAAEIGRNMK